MPDDTVDAALLAYIGAYIQEVREIRRLTREGVSAASGVSVTSIAQYERGEHRMPLPVFLRICLYLGMDPARVVMDILEGNDLTPFEP